jgi:hypothetical protein
MSRVRSFEKLKILIIPKNKIDTMNIVYKKNYITMIHIFIEIFIGISFIFVVSKILPLVCKFVACIKTLDIK